MAGLLGDFRACIRGLAARPLLVFIAVASLGLGIGVNTAIYSMFHQVALRSLPVAEPGRLVNLSAPGPKPGSTSSNNSGGRDAVFSYPMWRDLRAAQQPFTGIAAHRYLDVNLGYAGRTRTGSAALVSGEYFSLLGLSPTLGRLLLPSDDQSIGGSAVAVLSHAYWRDELGAAADVIGRSISINGTDFAVVGVAPVGFEGTTFSARPAAFVPLTQRWTLESGATRDDEDRSSYWLYLFARLKPGVSIQEAQTAINAAYVPLVQQVELPLQGKLDPVERERFAGKQLVLEPGARGQSRAAESASLPLALLLGTAALVLLIACLNIANLMLARGAARAGEFAVRASIGASHARLLRQSMLDAVMLGGLGLLASVPAAGLALRALVAILPISQSAFAVQLDTAAMQFAACVAFAAMVVFGLFPAMQLARTQPMRVLRGESGQAGANRTAARFRSALAIAQIAFSMTALVLAGLFTQTLANIAAVDPGVRAAELATFSLSPRRNGYTAEAAADLFGRVEEGLSALPGVASAATAAVPVLAGSEHSTSVKVEGLDEGGAEDAQSLVNQVSPAYFATMGIPLLAGRQFDVGDTGSGAAVAVINRRFAETFKLGPNPIGKRMARGSGDAALDIEIVGLVENSAYSDVRQPAEPVFYLPLRPDARAESAHFYVRGGHDPAALLPQMRALVAALDANLPVENLLTVPAVIEQQLAGERFIGMLSASLAGLATVLAALGLYGVLSYTLAQRRREFGLRLALGAAPPRMRALILRQVARLTTIGAALGLLAALAIGRAAQSLLFGLQGHDPLVLAGATLALAAVAFSAGFGPAWRASRIDPMLALRHE